MYCAVERTSVNERVHKAGYKAVTRGYGILNRGHLKYHCWLECPLSMLECVMNRYSNDIDARIAKHLILRNKHNTYISCFYIMGRSKANLYVWGRNRVDRDADRPDLLLVLTDKMQGHAFTSWNPWNVIITSAPIERKCNFSEIMTDRPINQPADGNKFSTGS